METRIESQVRTLGILADQIANLFTYCSVTV